MTSSDDYFPELTRQQAAEVLRLTGEIDEFKGHWRKVNEVRAERLAQLRQVTTIESTASSTRIEGASLSDAEVARVLSGLHVDSFQARDESEVRGYAELISLVYDNSAEIPLTENHLKQLHGILLKYSTKDQWHLGAYKKLPNNVEARYDDGRTETIFETATPFDTPRLMSVLVVSTTQALDQQVAHSLVVIARFIVDFMSVHPFQDGNGRLACVLSTLLMLRAGYDYVPFTSLERIVEENKSAYYASLRESQLAMRTSPAAFGVWLLFFLRALRAQQQVLEVKLRVERSMLVLSDLQQRIVEHVTTQGRATTTQISAVFFMPVRTVRYHLDVLVGRGLLRPHGYKKGRYYTRALEPSAQSAGSSMATSTNVILAEIYEAGGRISRRELLKLVKKHGYDGRTVGILHGRREAHLRRDAKTNESILTARGEEVARQYVFAKRLSARSQAVPDAAEGF